MGTSLKRFQSISDPIGGRDDEQESLTPLGDRLRGRFADVDVDSVETVRDIRERE